MMMKTVDFGIERTKSCTSINFVVKIIARVQKYHKRGVEIIDPPECALKCKVKWPDFEHDLHGRPPIATTYDGAHDRDVYEQWLCGDI